MKYIQKAVVTSTNTLAKNMIKTQPELIQTGFVITANKQTQGKGTKGRKWESESVGGLYYTLAFKPAEFKFQQVKQYHLDIAAVIATVTKTITQQQLIIKPPNDLFLNEKKVGGILMESATTSAATTNLNYLIIGVGLNINQKTFPKQLAGIATSLCIETQQSFDKTDFIKPMTNQLVALFAAH